MPCAVCPLQPKAQDTDGSLPMQLITLNIFFSSWKSHCWDTGEGSVLSLPTSFFAIPTQGRMRWNSEESAGSVLCRGGWRSERLGSGGDHTAPVHYTWYLHLDLTVS